VTKKICKLLLSFNKQSLRSCDTAFRPVPSQALNENVPARWMEFCERWLIMQEAGPEFVTKVTWTFKINGRIHPHRVWCSGQNGTVHPYSLTANNYLQLLQLTPELNKAMHYANDLAASWNFTIKEAMHAHFSTNRYHRLASKISWPYP
jgi:hypothetical protein